MYVCIYIYFLLFFLSLLFSTFLPLGWDDTLFSGLLVSSALWKSQSDVDGADLFSFCKFLMLFSIVPVTVIFLYPYKSYVVFQLLLSVCE
jgi:hypothetical protein